MKNYPLIKFVLLFICGIVLQKVFNFENSFLLIFLACLIFPFAVLFFKKSFKSRHVILNIILFASVITLGAAYLSTVHQNRVSYPFEKYKNKNSTIWGKVTEVELKREGQLIFNVKVDSVTVENSRRKISINVLCRIYDDDEEAQDSIYGELSVGNCIQLRGTIQKGREKRNPGEFNYYKYLVSENIAAICNSYNYSDLKIVDSNKDTISNAVFEIRKNIDYKITQYHSKETAALIRGLLLADRSKINYDLRESFVNAGVVHVLAVSGLHVGFIALIFLFLFGRMNIYLRYLFTILGLIFFVILTGSPPSVFRSSVMAIILIVALLTNRSYNSINSLALAALILLALNPNELFNPGFQLSFSAVISIVLIYPVLKEKIYSCPINSFAIQKLLLFISVSLAAQLGTLPFTLIYFHKLSLVSLFANLLVIPAIGVIIALAILTLVLSLISSWLAFTYAAVTNMLVYLLFRFVDYVGSSSASHIYIGNFSLFDSIIYYAAITAFIFYWRVFVFTRAKIVFTIFIILATALFVRLDNKPLLAEGKLSILVVDVGQGDSILIKFPNGQTVLVDAGDLTEYFDNGERIILPLLQYLGIDKINYGFISHMDSDHFGGYLALLKTGMVEQIYKPIFDSSNNNDVNFEKLVDSFHIPIHYYGKEIIEIGGARIYVLNAASKRLLNIYDTNDTSGILKLVYGDTAFLFMGDAGFEAENLLVNSFDIFLDADLLKIGHHGSKNSTSQKFLNFVSPSIAVISAGIQNRFNHPSEEVVQKLKLFCSEIHRTDQLGGILYQSDGYNIKSINWQTADENMLSNY